MPSYFELPKQYEDYLLATVNPQNLLPAIGEDWCRLAQERMPIIMELRQELGKFDFQPPFYTATYPLRLAGRFFTDLGDLKERPLSIGLYLAHVFKKFIFDSQGKIISVAAGRNTPLSFSFPLKSNYCHEQTTVLDASSPPVKVHQLTTKLLDVHGLEFSQDIILLLTLATQETLNEELHRKFRKYLNLSP